MISEFARQMATSDQVDQLWPQRPAILLSVPRRWCAPQSDLILSLSRLLTAADYYSVKIVVLLPEDNSMDKTSLSIKPNQPMNLSLENVSQLVSSGHPPLFF